MTGLSAMRGLHEGFEGGGGRPAWTRFHHHHHYFMIVLLIIILVLTFVVIFDVVWPLLMLSPSPLHLLLQL